jgi:hypothetical protein
MDRKVDLTNLLEMTDSNGALVSKYIGIFLNSAAVELNNIQNALLHADGNLLYSTLHILKPQIELMGIKNILPELKLAEAALQENKEVTEAIRKSTGFILSEITLACNELAVIQKQYL